MASNSQLEDMLKKGDCTVDQILDGDYLGDIKNQNEKLIEL
jgi:hypothetical protein